MARASLMTHLSGVPGGCQEAATGIPREFRVSVPAPQSHSGLSMYRMGCRSQDQSHQRTFQQDEQHRWVATHAVADGRNRGSLDPGLPCFKNGKFKF